jgi:hypothetical protein
MVLGSTQPLVKMSTRNIPGGKGGRCVRLTTSPPSCTECHEIWDPKHPGVLWVTPGLLRDSFTFLLQADLINYLSILLFVLWDCFICVLFIVLCYLYLYVVLFLLSTTWLLTQCVNKWELNSVELNYYINMFSPKHLFFLQTVIRVVVVSTTNAVQGNAAVSKYRH